MELPEVIPSFDVRVPDIRRVGLDRPWEWLAAGWRDLLQAPTVSMSFGLILAIAGALLCVGLWMADLVYLVLPLAAGFMIVGPFMGLAFYEVSRRRASGEPITFGTIATAIARNPRHFGVMGFILLLILLTWIRIGAMIFMLYWGMDPPPLHDLIVNTFLRPESLPFLVLGTAVGAVFAGLTFAVSVVSIPMMLDRRVDVLTAVVTSVRVVRHNPAVMLFWAILIVGFVGVGIATLFLGLIVALPLIGHASWHAYKDLVLAGPNATPADAGTAAVPGFIAPSGTG
jgi:uncharacterized membrane protein